MKLRTVSVRTVLLLGLAVGVPVSGFALDLPTIPTNVVAGGEVILATTIPPSGLLVPSAVFVDTPPFTDLLAEAVGRWRVEELGERPGGALVIGLFRPPAFAGPTLGTPPRRIAEVPPPLPSPISTPMPLYPPTARGDRVVLVVLRIGERGGIERIRRIESTPFDEVAVDTLLDWRFEPGRPGIVLAVLGFREPVDLVSRRIEPGPRASPGP